MGSSAHRILCRSQGPATYGHVTRYSANDPYANLKQDFAVAKALVAATAVSQGATDGGALTVAEAYHATLVSPFCFAATRSFFANH